jgi:hypothetical protein
MSTIHEHPHLLDALQALGQRLQRGVDLAAVSVDRLVKTIGAGTFERRYARIHGTSPL